MSQLQKAISRIQRREGPRLGFGPSTREQPRATLLGTVARDASGAKAAVAAGVDVVIVATDAASAATGIVKALDRREGLVVGVQLGALDESGAAALAEAKCDFVISPLATTESAAVDSDRMGHVVAVETDIDDTTLRALGPLGLEGLFVARTSGAMTLADQLQLVRLASFASTPLLATIGAEATVGELRALRDSGVAVVVAPEGVRASQIEALITALKAVPAPKKGRREGADIALVPSVGSGGHDHEEEEEDEPE